MQSVEFFVSNKKIIEQYEYRGEGNVHLALALNRINKILLIRKSDNNTDKPIQEEDIHFHNNVMQPLLTPFVDEVSKVTISGTEMERISKEILEKRPEFRRHKSLSTKFVVLCNDYTCLGYLGVDSIAIEIKPKFGIPDSNNKCLFCSKQDQKIKTGRIKTKTKYCPQDMFSNDKAIILKALTNLLENPQNNLQLYKNSKLFYSETIGNLNESNTILEQSLSGCSQHTFLKLLASILTEETKRTNDCTQCTDKETNILNAILQLQMVNNEEKLATSERGYLDTILQRVRSQKSDEVLCDKCKIWKCLYGDLITFYMSKIARDCSIIIAISSKTMNMKVTDNCQIIKVDGLEFLYKARILDLFPKPEKPLT